ncbi:MAG TPA: hypothetical protein VK403_10215, partial [Allosphingosinicella sp.]|nr:hypothetical protein [Allosphingosinicella sp.]
WLQNAAARGHLFAQRILLGVKERNARSMFEKFLIRLKITSLGGKWIRETLKDPHSDKVR